MKACVLFFVCAACVAAAPAQVSSLTGKLSLVPLDKNVTIPGSTIKNVPGWDVTKMFPVQEGQQSFLLFLTKGPGIVTSLKGGQVQLTMLSALKSAIGIQNVRMFKEEPHDVVVTIQDASGHLSSYALKFVKGVNGKPGKVTTQHVSAVTHS